MKIVSVVGARPQFIKAAVLSAALRNAFDEVLVHTGQHYDDLMSDVFFRELGLPTPDTNLGVGSASHAVQTARMLEGLEAVYLRESPDLVLVYGDTNSTLAGALAASKLGLPVAHVEAGFRSYERDLPEETNRVLTDHIATYLFCATQGAVDCLAREGITRGVHSVGDLMYDSLLAALPRAEAIKPGILSRHGLLTKPAHPDALEGRATPPTPPLHPLSSQGEGAGGEVLPYYLATIHRAATTDDPRVLSDVLTAFGRLDAPVILPAHPRTAAAMSAAGIAAPANVRTCDPVGYFEMLALESAARCILTDSGGVRREAFFLSVPCVTLRNDSEWPETVATGWDVLAGSDIEAIVSAARRPRPRTAPPPLFGDGQTAAKIVEILQNDPPHGRS